MIYYIILSIIILHFPLNVSSSALSYDADVSSETDKKFQTALHKIDVSSQSISQVHEILRNNPMTVSEPIMRHHDHRHEVVTGSIVSKSPTETVINIDIDEKQSDDRQTPPPSNDNYTKRFVVITNSVTALTTALIGAGVAILIHFKGCNS